MSSSLLQLIDQQALWISLALFIGMLIFNFEIGEYIECRECWSRRTPETSSEGDAPL